MKLFIDLETYSEVDLKAYGAYSYAEHPSTRIDLMAFAVDDGEVTIVDLRCQETIPTMFYALYERDDVQIVAQNCHFENAMLTYCLGLDQLPASRWIDTMAIANSVAYPAGLDGMCEILELDGDVAKLKDGKKLVQLFCKPNRGKRAGPETHPEEWNRYREYVHNDVTSLREVFRLLPKMNFERKEFAYEWEVDWNMNTQGVAADIEFCDLMLPLVEKRNKWVNDRLSELTDGRVTSVGQIQRIVKEMERIQLPNLQSETVETALLDPDLLPHEREILELRAEAGKAAVKKYRGFIDRANEDERVRGFMILYGASRTGRYSSKGVQLHNLVKPTLKWPAILDGIYNVLLKADIPVTDIFEIASSALRSVIVPDPMHILMVSDLSQIEARVLPWLAGQTETLEVFESGLDIYIATAAKMYHIPYDDITDDQRFMGKTAVLALGYGQWTTGFCNFCAKMGIDMDEDRAYDIIVAWRDSNPKVVTYWKALEAAARKAIYNPGQGFTVREKVTVCFDEASGDLHILLPSGRTLVYPKAYLSRGDIHFRGRYADDTTYGGKLVENVTQAVARDVMAENLPKIAQCGYPVLLTVHDEVISQRRILDTTRTVKALSELLAARPHWAPDLPLGADGFETSRYRKG